MSRKERYPRDTNAKKPTQAVYKAQCSKGWHCRDLLDNRCQLSHDRDDLKYAKKIQTTFRHSQTVVILDTYDSKLSPVCLLDPFLVPNITNLHEFKMDVGRYYLAQIQDNQRPRSIDLIIQKELGQFGKWEVQQRILHDYFPKEYQLPSTDKETKKGEVKINGQYQKVITGSQGKKYYFPIVNKTGPYPILGGCKVNYFERNNTIELTKIIYPHQIRLCGIVQIDKNSQFYLVSRNEEYDDMNPYHVPTEIAEKLTEVKGLFPYSFLRSEPIAEKDQQKVNDILKEYLVKGRFKAWPHQSLYPIIELLDEVSFKNFKSLKDGIIYQAGISMTPFDKKQKEQSQKISKNFKIQDHGKKRGMLTKSIFTVDSKSTKCHDDALFIQPTSLGQFYVQIHIADVAALIKQGDNIDKKIKKRDETIYIKNYHQPMLYDSLKNLFSLFQEEDRLAFTLAFKVNAKGFIDYKTVQFHRNIINVEKNLCHEKIESGSESYPQLRQLNQLFQRSKLIDNNYILQSQTKSQIAINRLIFISSIIPTFLLDVNIKRAKEFKEKFEHYLKDMIDKRKKDMQKWEDILDRIDKEKDNERKYKKQLGAIQKKIDNEVKKQRAAVMKRLKDENKDPVKKEKKEIIVRGSLSSKNIQSEDEEDDILDLEQDFDKAEEKRQKEEEQQEKEEQVKQQEEKVKKEKRVKALKEVHASDFQSSSQQSSQEGKSQSDSELLDEQYRFNAAVGGKRFLEKIFRHPLFNIDMKWSSLEEINNAFKTILSKDKGKLYQEYFKRLQIMNRQHFRYIVKMEKDSRREKQEKRPIRREQRVDASDEPQQKKRRYIIQEQKMEEKQEKRKEKRQEDIEKEVEYITQARHNKKQQVVVSKQNTRHRKINEELKQEQLIKKTSTDEYIAQKSNYQTMVKNIDAYMKKQRQRFIEKYMKQYQKDKQLKDVDLSFNQNDKEYLRDNQMENYMNQKEKVLLSLLQEQEKKIRRMAEREQKKMQKKQSQQVEKVEKFEQQPIKNIEIQQIRRDVPRKNAKKNRTKAWQQSQKQKRQAKKAREYKIKGIIAPDNACQAKKAEKQEEAPQISQKEVKTSERQQQVSEQQKILMQKIQAKVESKIEYYTQKYKSALEQDQKIEFSSDEEMEEDSLQTKAAYKHAKRIAIFKLFGKKPPEEKKKFHLDKKMVKLTYKLINYMDTEKEKMIEKYAKFYEQDAKLTNLDISFTERDEKMRKDVPLQDYKKYKISRLRILLKKNAKQNKRKAPKQPRGKKNKGKKEVQDIEKQDKIAQEKVQPIKGQEIVQESKSDKLKKNEEIKKVEASKGQQSLVHRLLSFMEAEKERLIAKYAQKFEEDRKMTDLDISFTERDQQIIKDEPLQTYKKEKMLRLKIILRRNMKSNHKKMRQQAKKGEDKKEKTKPIKEKVKKNEQKILEILKEEDNGCQIKKKEKLLQQKNLFQQQKPQKTEELLKQQVNTLKEMQLEPSLKVKESKEKKPEKLGKKAMKKKIDDLMHNFTQELTQRYKTEKQTLASKLQEINQSIKKQEKNLEEELSSVNEEYNLLQLLAGQQKSQKKETRKSKKDKKKDNEKTKAEKSSVLGKFLDNFQLYADKAHYKFQKMSITQLDEYLTKILTIKQLCSDSLDSIQELNRQASKKGQAQQSLLKWNNPIRSYESLTVMRMIQSYKWLFEGQVYPSDIIRYYSDIKHIEKQLKELQEYRNKKIEKGELNKKVKEANRQISKLEFYNLLKRDENAVFTFLNIGSPCIEKVKFVFHPILEEVEVDNLEFKQDAYKEVKGRVRIVRQFPLKLKIILEK